MFGLGVPELLVILVVVVVAFGPRRLPQLGEALGSSIRSFRSASREAGSTDAALPSRGTRTQPPESTESSNGGDRPANS
jgi:sec-independent protein translocase protein TatA